MTTQHSDGHLNITAEHWENLNFEGKEYCILNDDGELMLKATDYFPERKLSALTEDNCRTITNSLCEKFKEVRSKLDELEKEWEQSPDKLKIAGKVARFKDYLQHANAIGDFGSMYRTLQEKETILQSMNDENYQKKLSLAEKAESLKDTESWKETTEAFRQIIDDWKHVAPADKGRNEKLWQRIENARAHFYERKRRHQEDVEHDMMQNLDLKLELCEQAEQLAGSEEWKKTSDIMKEMMEKWKTIGRVASAEKNEELWNKFTNARNQFFDRKKIHFEQIQSEQEQNYAGKLALVEKAEQLAESKDWKETTAAMSQLMDDWKAIGKVPFEKADELWNRLQAARDSFFNAKRQNAEEFKLGLEDNYAQKMALLNRAEKLQHSNNWKEVTEELNELMQEWKKIGHIPREYGDELWNRFIQARQNFFKRKDDDRDQRRAKFKNQLDSRLEQTIQFLNKIKQELAEEEDKLADFKESLSQTTGEGQKEEELRTHLGNLIAQIERKLPARREKVEEVSRQLEELEQKRSTTGEESKH